LLVVSLPLLFGLGVDLALQRAVLPNPILIWRITIDVGTLALIAGLALSILGWFGSWLSWYWIHRSLRTLELERQRQGEDHRRFIRRLDHEIKNPLAILQVALSEMRREALDEPRLNVAQEQLARMNRLTQNLRKLADLQDYMLDCESVDLTELIREAIEAAQSVPGREDRAVSLHMQRVPWTPAPVMGDEDLLLLAFYNLIDNALKYTTSESEIEIRVGETGSMVIIEVADNGPGIPEGDLAHVFEELYRGEGSRQVEGSGLGLALVQRIVERHDGQVVVCSRVGQGTVFTVTLPVQ
jgi:two-component system OmpR family sensor kinase